MMIFGENFHCPALCVVMTVLYLGGLVLRFLLDQLRGTLYFGYSYFRWVHFGGGLFWGVEGLQMKVQLCFVLQLSFVWMEKCCWLDQPPTKAKRNRSYSI